MSDSHATIRRVAVLGGGIAGLAAAHRLIELDPRSRLTLLEAGPRLGGVLSTVRRDGFEVEQSADNFITTIPWAVNLCRAAGADRPTRADQPGLPADVRRPRRAALSPARRLPHDGADADVAAGRHADPQPVGQAPRRLGILHSPAAGRRRREHGRLRPPPPRPRGLRSARRAAGGRRLRGRHGEAQRRGHLAAVPRNGAATRQPDPRDAAADEGSPQGQERKRRPLQHVRDAPRRAVEPRRRVDRPAAARVHSAEHARRADRAERRALAGSSRGGTVPRRDRGTVPIFIR